jgi:hypothetical protein
MLVKTGPTVYFVGPSLYGCRPKPLENEIWLPPAAQGDVLRAAIKYHPKQIVLIDGTYLQTLSVWVKELCYCLVEGIAPIGAASMGALRAADCWRYGMIGVGKIFERYRDGVTEDDSEVVLMYDRETYRPLSEPKIGNAQKAADALEAVALARSGTAKWETTLTRETISPNLEDVLRTIFDEEP